MEIVLGSLIDWIEKRFKKYKILNSAWFCWLFHLDAGWPTLSG